MAKRTKKQPITERGHSSGDRQVVDAMLLQGVRRSLDDGMVADELAVRVIRLVVMIASERIDTQKKLRQDQRPEWTWEALQREQERLESCWDGERVRRIVRQSLEALAKCQDR